MAAPVVDGITYGATVLMIVLSGSTVSAYDVTGSMDISMHIANIKLIRFLAFFIIIYPPYFYLSE